jgi:Sulfatase
VSSVLGRLPAAGARFLTRVGRHSTLPVTDVVRLIALIGPLVGYLMALKLVRIAVRQPDAGPLAVLDLLRSDLLLGLAIACGAATIVAVARPGVRRWIAFTAATVIVLLVALLETIAHLFFLRTGSPFDLAVASSAWGTRAEIGDLVGSELSPGNTAWLAAIAAWCLLGPSLVVSLAGRASRAPQQAPDAARSPHRFAVLSGGLAATLVVLAALPSASGTSFARDPLLNGALSPLEARRYAHAADLSSLSASPIDTKLVRTGSGRQRNVVLVFLESTRAISTSVEDPGLPTTPFLAELARTSLVADSAYTVVPHTSKALTAGHCGVTPPLDMNVTEAKPNGIAARCLPALLAEQGYRTAFFQSATEHYDRRRDLVRNLGYTDFYPVDVLDKSGFAKANYFGWEDDILLPPSRSWLTRHRDEPFLAGYLTVTSHHDYKVPATIAEEHLSDDPEFNRYLNTVHYGDRFVRRLIQQYKDLGLYDNTVFVVMADHGEGFGEHGVRQHDNTVYTEGVRIPLLVHDPRHPTPRRVTTPVQLTTVLPTVVEHLGYQVAGGSYPAAPVTSKTQPPVRIACHVDNSCLASIRGSEKYIFHFGQRPDEYFDLAADPGERHNLIHEQDPDKIAALRADLLRWRGEVRARTALRISAGQR